MKKATMSLAMAICISAAVFAQPAQKMKHEKKQPGNHREMKHMAFKELNLTEAQKTQMKASRDEFQKQMKALNSNESQTVKQLRDGQAALAKAQKAKFESILTTEQKNKLAELKTKAKAKHEERFAKHLDKMKEKLSLTDNQVASLKKNHEATANKLKALKDNDKLDRVAKREQLQSMKEDMKNSLDKVLTKEQKEKFESMKGEKKNKMKHKMKDRMDRKHKMMDKESVK